MARMRRRYGNGWLALSFPMSVALTVLAAWVWAGTAAGFLFAQGTAAKKKAGAEPIKGKIASIERKGKNATLKVTRDDSSDELEVLVTTRVPLMITADGDAGFLKPNVMVSGQVIVANQKLFARELTVHLGTAPPPAFAPSGQSREVFNVCGKVLGATAEVVNVQFAPPAGTQQIALEAANAIKVVSNDTALLKEGATIEIEGTALKTGKVNPLRIQVTLSEALNSEEVFKDKTKEPKTSSKTKSTAGKAKSETPAGDSADPFGVLNKKKPADGEKKEGDDKKADKNAGEQKSKGDEPKPAPKEPPAKNP